MRPDPTHPGSPSPGEASPAAAGVSLSPSPDRGEEERRFEAAAVARWLAAERQEGSAGAASAAPAARAAGGVADAALRDLLAALPPLAPRAGFAARVMATAELASRRAGAATARRPAARPWASPWLRAALLLCVATSGCALVWVPAVLHTLGDFWSPAELLEKSIAGLMSLHLWLASTLGVGQKLVLLCKAFAAPLAIAPFAVAAGVCLLISGAAFRVLRAVIHSDRRWVYVDPI
jgi:hypothetical protein